MDHDLVISSHYTKKSTLKLGIGCTATPVIVPLMTSLPAKSGSVLHAPPSQSQGQHLLFRQCELPGQMCWKALLLRQQITFTIGSDLVGVGNKINGLSLLCVGYSKSVV